MHLSNTDTKHQAKINLHGQRRIVFRTWLSFTLIYCYWLSTVYILLNGKQAWPKQRRQICRGFPRHTKKRCRSVLLMIRAFNVMEMCSYLKSQSGMRTLLMRLKIKGIASIFFISHLGRVLSKNVSNFLTLLEKLLHFHWCCILNREWHNEISLTYICGWYDKHSHISASYIFRYLLKKYSTVSNKFA